MDSETALKLRKYPEAPPTTEVVPLIPYKVLHTDLPFYRDQQCTQQVEEARACILVGLDPDDVIIERDIVPTFATYEVGQFVEWSVESKRLWEQCWYVNPDTGNVERAWTFHVLFQGAALSDAAVEKGGEQLADLEKRTLARLSAVKTPPVN